MKKQVVFLMIVLIFIASCIYNIHKGSDVYLKEHPGKVIWGGAFAQRHAVHQSTQFAFDAIFKEFLFDIRKHLKE